MSYFQRLDQVSPLQPLRHPSAEAAGVNLWIKRDDQLLLPKKTVFPAFCGNKWRKLRYNLEAAREQQKNHLLTFGGAYSNHIAAVAAAGSLFNFRTTGIIRGEAHEPLNPTLAFAKKSGMRLEYVSRSAFRQKDPVALAHSFPDGHKAYVLPDGGTNAEAIRGCRELSEEIHKQLGFAPDHLCVTAGTGGTAAGLIAGAQSPTQVHVYSALKGDFLRQEIQRWLPDSTVPWYLVTDYHFGGYAKWTDTLLEHMDRFRRSTGILLDPIYTGKLVFGVLADMERGYFPRGSSVVMVHTGGLQGLAGFRERFS